MLLLLYYQCTYKHARIIRTYVPREPCYMLHNITLDGNVRIGYQCVDLNAPTILINMDRVARTYVRTVNKVLLGPKAQNVPGSSRVRNFLECHGSGRVGLDRVRSKYVSGRHFHPLMTDSSNFALDMPWQTQKKCCKYMGYFFYIYELFLVGGVIYTSRYILSIWAISCFCVCSAVCSSSCSCCCRREGKAECAAPRSGWSKISYRCS